MSDQKEVVVDWKYWLALSSITMTEAVCLLANVEPFELNLESIDEHPALKKPFRMIFRAWKDQELGQFNIYNDGSEEPRFSPQDLKEWIRRKQEMFSHTENTLVLIASLEKK